MSATIRTHRRSLLALVLALCLAATFLALHPVSQAQAQYRCGNEFFYYSDDTYTYVVGYQVWDCNCYYSSWGVLTDYRQIQPLEYC
jgi:hypothetical protein